MGTFLVIALLIVLGGLCLWMIADDDPRPYNVMRYVLVFACWGTAGILLMSMLQNLQLLKACPEQARVKAEREFVCIVPVNVRIKDGGVAEVTLDPPKPDTAKAQ